MLINEVCKKCSLTKKAIEYYTEQGLIVPAIQENGYRSFTDEDVQRLKKISVLRNLGLSAAEIRLVLSSTDAAALSEIAEKKKLEITTLQEKQKLIQELADKRDWEHVHDQLQHFEKRQSVLERLLNVFPGYYGKYAYFHFAAYLNEPVVTGEQQEAFDTIIDFLDNTDFRIPEDLQKYVDEALSEATVRSGGDVAGFVEKMTAGIQDALQNPEGFLAGNREIIENYIAYLQSAEYKASPAYRWRESFLQFGRTSGYNDIFIPAMCRLSKSYREYHEALERADEKLLQEYPQYVVFF